MEIRVIPLLIDILYYPFKQDFQKVNQETGEEEIFHLYSIGRLGKHHAMTKTCRMIYRLLKHIVKDNTFNKHYVAQWFNYFAD